MKSLKVPYLEMLDVLSPSSIDPVLEKYAQREYVDVLNWKSEYGYKPIVAFDIARSKTHLYIRYFVKGNSLKAEYGINNSPVHQDSCVEFFMQKAGDSNYMNFEFNCIGTCDAARRESREKKSSLSQEEYASIKTYSSLGTKPFPEKEGVFAWELTVVIPFTLMGLDPNNLPQKIMGNFYKCADNTQFPHFVSWNPIDLPEPNFHCPKFFGEIYF
ncbi:MULTISPECIES: carbohydrate-binding family 9-like protein [Parabacteroides]|uniref:carbohydrate-binding family 9-like protein n=1 Tax=Parabacteroides provencensis TaxID=1944636 RepID=UPI000C16004C|nr:carbohydrate-binding family 9-like protein [Parabacteroides provencensis]